MLEERPYTISKLLSVNDTGENGSHQAGILVPKQKDILGFFPDLGCEEKNPRASLSFEDESGKRWRFTFIYYNNKFFSERGTRNEYRLTGMTAYLRESHAEAGDTIYLTRRVDGSYSVRITKPGGRCAELAAGGGAKRVKIVASSSWKVVSI